MNISLRNVSFPKSLTWAIQVGIRTSSPYKKTSYRRKDNVSCIESISPGMRSAAIILVTPFEIKRRVVILEMNHRKRSLEDKARLVESIQISLNDNWKKKLSSPLQKMAISCYVFESRPIIDSGDHTAKLIKQLTQSLNLWTAKEPRSITRMYCARFCCLAFQM